MKHALTCLFSVFAFLILQAQVKISTDFTDSSKEKQELHNVWRVANRISPENGVVIRNGVDANIVRMVGGVNKIVNGQRVPNYDFDPVRYDSVSNLYVYNFTGLLSRIDAIRNSSTKLFQIVLDQPAWAFQHGYNFIPDDQPYNGTDFKESERQTVYGNSLPPKDRVAFRAFIKAMMQKILDTYGESEALSWRYRVGSEIETPDHWRGTKQDFIDHFEDIEQSVRSVLPEAKIGLHTRAPDFLFRNGTITNYKGEPFASFVTGLIEYSFDNNLRYDFWGISDYIIVNNARSLNLGVKYDQLFAPLINHPKWNANAKIDVMEYAPIISIAPPENDGGSFFRAATTHAELVDLSFSHDFYKNRDKGFDQIYRWGTRSGRDDGVVAVINNMVGKTRYETNISGSPAISTNRLDAIFAKGNAENKFDVLVYNFNDSSLNYRDAEAVEVSFNLDVPVGSKIYYRSAVYGKEQNNLQAFLEDEPASGWVKPGWDRRGTPERILNAAGLAAWANYVNPTPYTFSDWINITTIPRTDGGSGSLISLQTEMPSFAYKKYEFQAIPDFVQDITLTKVIWETTEDFQLWRIVRSNLDIDTNDDKLTLNFLESSSFPMVEIANLNINSDNFDTLRIVVKNTTTTTSIQFAANVPGGDFSSSRRVVNVPISQDFQTIDVDISDWILWQGIINQFKVYANTKSGSLIFDSLEFIPSSNAEVLNVTLTQEGNGLLNYRSGTCFVGRELKLVAIPDEGWEFAGWTGGVTSNENPLNITVETDLNIKATFSNTLSVDDVIFNKKTKVYPNPSETGVFKISNDETWSVYSMSGAKILSGKGDQIDLSNFKTGVYLLKTENKSFKLLKL